MTGVDFLALLALRVSHDLLCIVMQALYADFIVRFTFRLLFLYAGRITKTEKLCYLCKEERFHRNRRHILKVRTNLYASGKLPTIIFYNRFRIGIDFV